MKYPSALLLVSLSAAAAPAAEPRVLVDGYKLELIAREPDVVTPIGMAFDKQGRLLVIESHTHQRPDDYAGPPGDRIRMLSDSDGDGRLDRWSTFAEGYQQAMNLCLHPDGGVYVATRRDVRLLEDTDGDGASNKETPILRLVTEAEYPHNGLSAIHVAANSGGEPRLTVGLGENFGFAYRLVGSDDDAISGRGGVGTIFSCNLDGSRLARVAVGFWNPFSVCTLGGRMFCIENDPDASPPCRLIHIVLTGDYGHRWEYGRAGVHPLQAWNGELPGTLPMICGVGEAPTGIVAHRNMLWVTSWGDHRIERYELTPTGATFTAKCTIVAQGDAEFRPTGMALAPDGSLYFGDWVDRSYPVHHKGRIWRLSVPASEQAPPLPDERRPRTDQLAEDAAADDPFLRQAVVARLAGNQFMLLLPGVRWDELVPRQRLCGLQLFRWLDAGKIDPFTGQDPRIAPLRRILREEADPDLRLYAVRWIADERIAELRDDVAKLLDGAMPNERYFLAVLAAIEWLDGDAAPRASGISDGLLRRELADPRRSPQIKALALRLISPDHEWLTIDRLREYLASDEPELRLEAVRTLAMQTRPERFPVLAEIAADEAYNAELRAEATSGLAPAASSQLELLETLAASDEAPVAGEAQRILRLVGQRPPASADRPSAADLDAWNAMMAAGGDPVAGRRLFFLRGAGPQCAACHQHSGRGGRVGPDLTSLGRQQSRERILASILQPSREIAPHYQAWTLITSDGLSHQGLRLPEGGDDGTEPYADPQGVRFELRSEDIELRSPSDRSIMPDGLCDALSADELRDLIAFLAATPN